MYIRTLSVKEVLEVIRTGRDPLAYWTKNSDRIWLYFSLGWKFYYVKPVGTVGIQPPQRFSGKNKAIFISTLGQVPACLFLPFLPAFLFLLLRLKHFIQWFLNVESIRSLNQEMELKTPFFCQGNSGVLTTGLSFVYLTNLVWHSRSIFNSLTTAVPLLHTDWWLDTVLGRRNEHKQSRANPHSLPSFSFCQCCEMSVYGCAFFDKWLCIIWCCEYPLGMV